MRSRLFVNTHLKTDFEFQITNRNGIYSFELINANAETLLTSVDTGITLNENIRSIYELKTLIHKPGRIEKIILEDYGLYFIINNFQKEIIASSMVFFSHRQCFSVIHLLKIILPAVPINSTITKLPSSNLRVGN
jgi:hypothetical protein